MRRPDAGERAVTVIDGDRKAGTIRDVTYTPRKGYLAAWLALDDPTADGREVVAVALEDLEPEE